MLSIQFHLPLGKFLRFDFFFLKQKVLQATISRAFVYKLWEANWHRSLFLKQNSQEILKSSCIPLYQKLNPEHEHVWQV